jgi:hypothetical protein
LVELDGVPGIRLVALISSMEPTELRIDARVRLESAAAERLQLPVFCLE